MKSNNMIIVKPTGSRKKNDFPALDIRENQRNASPNPFDDDDEINLHAPTLVQYGNEPKENKSAGRTRKMRTMPRKKSSTMDYSWTEQAET